MTPSDLGQTAVDRKVDTGDVARFVRCEVVGARSELLLSQGPTLEILTAAASIPGVFPPVRMGERSLVDGGVNNNTPIFFGR